MRHAGFVLVGGKSSRMGCDKAFLTWRGRPLAQHIAHMVETAAGSVTLIGDEARYSLLGYPVVADRLPGRGPIGGLATALSISEADWNLVAGCDMPLLDTDLLRRLIGRTGNSHELAI